MAPLIVQLIAWAGVWIAGLTGLLPAAATPLRHRLPMQLFWIACLLWVARDGR